MTPIASRSRTPVATKPSIPAVDVIHGKQQQIRGFIDPSFSAPVANQLTAPITHRVAAMDAFMARAAKNGIKISVDKSPQPEKHVTQSSCKAKSFRGEDVDKSQRSSLVVPANKRGLSARSANH